MNAARKANGFTLIELMITIALIGILVAVATPSMTTMVEATRYNGANRTLATLIERGRLHALTTRSRVEITPNVGANTITVRACRAQFAVPTSCAASTSLTPISHGVLNLNSEDHHGVNIESVPASALVFGPRGIPENTGTTYRYRLGSARSLQRREVVVSAAGEVHVN